MCDGVKCVVFGCTITFVGLIIITAVFIFADLGVSEGDVGYEILMTDSNLTVSSSASFTNLIWPDSFIKLDCDPHPSWGFVADECEYLAQHKSHMKTRTIHSKRYGVESTKIEYWVEIPLMDAVAYWTVYKVITATACILSLCLAPIPCLLGIIYECFKKCIGDITINWFEKNIWEKPKFLMIIYWSAMILWFSALIMIYCPIKYESSSQYSAKSILKMYFDNHSNDRLIVFYEDINEEIGHAQLPCIYCLFGCYFVWFCCYWALQEKKITKLCCWCCYHQKANDSNEPTTNDGENQKVELNTFKS